MAPENGLPWMLAGVAATFIASVLACITPCGGYDGCNPWFEGINVSSDEVLVVEGYTPDTGDAPPTLGVSVLDGASGETRTTEGQLEYTEGEGFRLPGEIFNDWSYQADNPVRYCPADAQVTFDLRGIIVEGQTFESVEVGFDENGDDTVAVELWNGWTVDLAWNLVMC